MRYHMSFFVLFPALLFPALLLAQPGTPLPQSSPGTLLEKLQKAWDATLTYEANFRQVIFDKRLGTREESHGVLYVEKPSHLRWESKTDKSIQIMNGKELYVITHNKRRGTRVVDIYTDAGKAVGSRPLNFLSGKVKFKEIYHVQLLSETPEMAEMKLTPKEDAAETLIAEIDKVSYLLRSLTSETVDSRVKTEFTGTKTNAKFDKKLFIFKPTSADVIHKN